MENFKTPQICSEIIWPLDRWTGHELYNDIFEPTQIDKQTVLDISPFSPNYFATLSDEKGSRGGGATVA